MITPPISVPAISAAKIASSSASAARSRTARVSWPLTLIGEVGVSRGAPGSPVHPVDAFLDLVLEHHQRDDVAAGSIQAAEDLAEVRRLLDAVGLRPLGRRYGKVRTSMPGEPEMGTAGKAVDNWFGAAGIVGARRYAGKRGAPRHVWVDGERVAHWCGGWPGLWG